MYIIKNAIRNITRAKIRNLLIGIIVVVIATASCMSLSIKESARKVQEDKLNELTITGTISLDRQAIMQKIQSEGGDIREEMMKYENLSLTDLKKYAKSSYVDALNYSMTSTVSAGDDLEPVDTSEQTTEEENSNRPQLIIRGERIGFGGMGNQGDFTITGYNSYNMMTDFINGTCKITDGEMFDETTDKNQCIISDELATLNDLKIGDKITVSNPNLSSEEYTLKVVGIYNNSQSADTGVMMRFDTSLDPANQIYTSYNTLNKIIKSSAKNANTSTDDNGKELTTALRSQVSGVYVFSNIENLEAFQKDATGMGLADYYTVSSPDASSYEQSIVPIQNLSKFADISLIVVLAIGGIILVVLNIFNIRERKYEVGVLTAIGMKKHKVAAQYVIELLIVTLFGILVGMGIGSNLSVSTANQLLESQITSAEDKAMEQNENFGGPRNIQGQQGNMVIMGGPQQTQVEYVTDINAAINMTVVGQLVIIGIVLTILASLVAVIFILRYEPLKILSNRA